MAQDGHNNTAMELASKAGHILLENGAEIARVSETMDRIAHHYGVEDGHFFVLSNGIFSTNESYADTRFIPIKGARLDKVIAVNQLSRDLPVKNFSTEEMRQRLDEIDHMKPTKSLMMLICAGLGAAGFCGIFGGSLLDCLADFAIGFLLYTFVIFLGGKFSKILSNLLAGLIATMLCIISYKIGCCDSLANIVTGAIFTLVPGVPFTNGVRDIANEDYIAGTTRLLDALLVFFSVALGVSIIFMLQGMIDGEIINLQLQSDPLTHNVIIQLVMAFIGTAAFSVLYNVPSKYYLFCGLSGMLGWCTYILSIRYAGCSPVIATFLGALGVALVSRFIAVKEKCPIITFLICGIFPLVPGAGIFWTSYYAVSDNIGLALSQGFLSLKVAIAIVLGIVILSDLPRSVKKKLTTAK